MTKPKWTGTLPGKYRVVQPHERVENGDYYQIGKAYALIDDAHRLHYTPSGGMYGTFWREEVTAPESER